MTQATSVSVGDDRSPNTAARNLERMIAAAESGLTETALRAMEVANMTWELTKPDGHVSRRTGTRYSFRS